ncbi:MAG: hypothetical protein ACE5QW_06980, partial [Thermoplasmata archaeon]
HKDLKGHREIPDHKDLKGHREIPDHKDLKGHREIPDRKDRRVLLAQMALMASPVGTSIKTVCLTYPPKTSTAMGSWTYLIAPDRKDLLDQVR